MDSGRNVGFGNRDDVPKESPLAGRADRAAKNMLENLVLFAVVLLAARGLGAQPSKLVLGCQIFFFSRVLYFGIYVAGVKYLRILASSGPVFARQVMDGRVGYGRVLNAKNGAVPAARSRA